MRRRIFIAVNLPEDIKGKLAEHQNRIEELLAPFRNEISGAGICRWTKKDNLHITLVFLGYVGDEELPDIFKTIKETALKTPPFSINLNRICYGPHDSGNGAGKPSSGKKPPRMIWAEGEKSRELAELQENLEISLTGKNPSFKKSRSFSPHITLARLKFWEFRAIEPQERPEINGNIRLSFEVNSIELMESRLKPRGSDYCVLEPFSLKNK